ncbi:MAG: hypothetical protein ACXQT4_05035 [Methanotrichaceae archaeon]
MISLDPLIVAGIVLIAVGIFYTLISARTGIVLMGMGSVASGVFLFTIVPDKFDPFSILFNGLLMVCGVWMMVTGAKHE